MSEDKKDGLTAWYKPNGSKIMLNNEDATVKHAKSLGWDTKKPSGKKAD